eukprot:243697_1
MYHVMTESLDTSIKHNNIDVLRLANKKEVQSLLKNEGLVNEHVVFSEEVIKFNAKGKQQRRILMITQNAIYNLKPKKLNKSQRRISIKNIGMLTLSECTNEFAVHVPSQYDYHFVSQNKNKIAQILKKLYYKQTMSRLIVVYSELKHLRDIILTKKLAKIEGRNSKQIMKETIACLKDDIMTMNENNEIETPNTEEIEEYEIVYKHDIDDSNSNDVTDVAIYQSLVYGNHQLLLQQNSKIDNAII